MTNKEILEENDKIEKHNKFCFMKKSIPLYKKPIPLSLPLTYAIISFSLLALPSFFKNANSSVTFSRVSNNQFHESANTSYIKIIK